MHDSEYGEMVREYHPFLLFSLPSLPLSHNTAASLINKGMKSETKSITSFVSITADRVTVVEQAHPENLIY